MTELTLRYGASRMVREYLDKAYLPAAAGVARAGRGRRRGGEGDGRMGPAAAARLAGRAYRRNGFRPAGSGWDISVPVYLGEIAAADVRVEIYAEPTGGAAAEVIALAHDGPVPGATGGYFYRGRSAERGRPVTTRCASCRRVPAFGAGGDRADTLAEVMGRRDRQRLTISCRLHGAAPGPLPRARAFRRGHRSTTAQRWPAR